jgi:hypothetical protein
VQKPSCYQIVIILFYQILVVICVVSLNIFFVSVNIVFFYFILVIVNFLFRNHQFWSSCDVNFYKNVDVTNKISVSVW